MIGKGIMTRAVHRVLEHAFFDLRLHRIVDLTRRFAIGKYQVSQKFWNTVTDSNPSLFRGMWRPTEMVSWLDCIVFCNLLSEQEGLEKSIFFSDCQKSSWPKPRYIKSCSRRMLAWRHMGESCLWKVWICAFVSEQLSWISTCTHTLINTGGTKERCFTMKKAFPIENRCSQNDCWESYKNEQESSFWSDC